MEGRGSRILSYVDALGARDFRLLFGARASSALGSGLVPVALAFAVLDLTGSATDVGYVLAARAVPPVLLLLVGGVWADRLPRNVVMLTTDVIQFGAQGIVGFLLVTDHAELWHLIVAQAVAGAANAFFMPASTGLVPHTIDPPRLQQANALLNLTQSTTSIVGPAIGGLLVATVGAGWAFVADSATYAVSAAFLARIRLPRAADRLSAPNFLAELRTGWDEFRQRTWMVVIDAWAILANMFVIAAFLVLGPFVSERELGGAAAWALILAAFGIGSLIGDVVALVIRPTRPLVVGCLAVSSFAFPLALLAVAAPAPLVAVGALLAAFGLTVFNTLFVTTMQEQVPQEALSRVTAYDWLASVAFMPLGFAIVGPVAAAVGTSALLWAGAAFQVVATVIMLCVPSVRNVRRAARPLPAG